MSFPRYPEYKDSGVEWLGKVPSHWGLRKIKYIASFAGGGTPSRDRPDYWNGEIPWVSPKDMKSERIIGAEETITLDGLANSTATLIPTQRILMVVRSGILKHTIPVAINDTPVALNQDIKSIHFPTHHCNPDYFLRWVQGLNDILLSIWAKQGATVESIEHDYLSNTTIALPPPAEQSAIVAFLNREVIKLDELVAEQQRLIELLKEEREAVISHAVTKGLNPDAPMKPSGVEWLGEVPAHWRIVPLGKVTSSRCDGPFGSGLKSDHYTDFGVRVVRLQNIGYRNFRSADAAFISSDYYERELGGHDVRAGDILIAGLGDENNVVGRACVAPTGIEPAMVKADCFRFRLDEAQASPEFVAAALSAGAAADAGRLSSGSTRSRIPLSTMATRRLALPSLAEQKQISSFTNAVVLKVDALMGEAQRAIELLQERRTALISAAVTGQIDVRAIAGKAAA
ncbi:restriction endonuclease subunit S [Corallococcus sp. AS-1-6]|uniref:restriction endonuclease subunit S n=1 Tax=Corallococcus sp. AS-1-6 TaxID=2874599 RepID=UPI001CBE4831|nr:restriction endonuclease subunit S [Corallococcus sp. AS-1-6]MBZ4377505.1 restriction endonuclease subunit S [Corallococcus sp. AS-1-6]